MVAIFADTDKTKIGFFATVVKVQKVVVDREWVARKRGAGHGLGINFLKFPCFRRL